MPESRRLEITTILLSVLVWLSLTFSFIFYDSLPGSVGNAVFGTWQWRSPWILAVPGAGIILAIVAFMSIRKSGLHSYARITVIIALSVGLLGIITVIGHAVLDESELLQDETCISNLKQIYPILITYANKNNYEFPPISNTKNNFVFNANALYPKYLRDVSILTCPSSPAARSKNAFRLFSTKHHPGASVSDVHPDCITDASYCYLGWAVIDDEQAEAFFRLYDKLSPEDYDKDIQVEWKGKPFALRRLASHIDMLYRYFTPPDYVASMSIWSGPEPSTFIPIMWDRRPYHVERNCEGHKNRGGNVLYLDGHVEFVPWGEEFPMTEAFAKMLDERKRHSKPDCDE